MGWNEIKSNIFFHVRNIMRVKEFAHGRTSDREIIASATNWFSLVRFQLKTQRNQKTNKII